MSVRGLRVENGVPFISASARDMIRQYNKSRETSKFHIFKQWLINLKHFEIEEVMLLLLLSRVIMNVFIISLKVSYFRICRLFFYFMQSTSIFHIKHAESVLVFLRQLSWQHVLILAWGFGTCNIDNWQVLQAFSFR